MNKLAKILSIISVSAALAVSAGFLYGCNSHTHTVEFVAGKQPTCSETGTIDHWHCIECGDNFSDPGAQNTLDTVVLATTPHRFFGGYSFDDEYHFKRCSDCNAIDEYSKYEHILSYKGDDEDHYFSCYCGYEGEHSPHFPNSGGNPCEVCGYGGITYKLSNSGEYYICTGVSSSYVDHIEELVIPDTYNNIPIKEIEERAFQHCSALKSVTLGKNVISIGYYAFLDCRALTSVQLNANLIEIQANAFNDCVSLEQIELPKRLMTLGNGVFQSCSSLKRIEIPTSIKVIQRQTFFNCIALEEVVLHNKIEAIDTAAFSNTAIESIVLPNGLTELPMTMFLSCSKLKSVTVPSTVKKINAAAFSGCTSLETIRFLGTREQWEAIEFINVPQAWNFATPEYTVICN